MDLRFLIVQLVWMNDSCTGPFASGTGLTFLAVTADLKVSSRIEDGNRDG
jgi:hypothetical protein